VPTYIDIETAKTAPGLRLVLTRVPGAPWTEAAKAVFDVKNIPYAHVAQVPGRTDDALRQWTGIANALIAVYREERPRDGWHEILLLAERLMPEPRLIPADPRERATMLGLTGELMSEDGLIWNRRLIMIEIGLREKSFMTEFVRLRGRDFGWSPEAAQRAQGRIIEVLKLFSEQLARQRAAGYRYMMGASLTALDLYWACACAIMQPLPPEHAAMPDALRQSYSTYPEAIRDALDPALLAHRDFIYREHLTLPLDT
jgi:glutathione S-transferase